MRAMSARLRSTASLMARNRVFVLHSFNTRINQLRISKRQRLANQQNGHQRNCEESGLSKHRGIVIGMMLPGNRPICSAEIKLMGSRAPPVHHRARGSPGPSALSALPTNAPYCPVNDVPRAFSRRDRPRQIQSEGGSSQRRRLPHHLSIFSRPVADLSSPAFVINAAQF